MMEESCKFISSVTEIELEEQGQISSANHDDRSSESTVRYVIHGGPKKRKQKIPWGFLPPFLLIVVICLITIPAVKRRALDSEDILPMMDSKDLLDSSSWKLDPSSYHLTKKGPWIFSNAQTREYFFNISHIIGNPDGVTKKMTVINGKFPGPVIEANKGDRIVVHVINSSEEPSSLHFHGIYQNMTNNMDGAYGITQCAIASGQSFTYNFTVENQSGTYWYHSHYGAQHLDGVIGPMVIHDETESSIDDQPNVEDYIVFLNDWYHQSASDLVRDYLDPSIPSIEPSPDSGMIQGSGSFDCQNTDRQCIQKALPEVLVNRNSTYRFRIINAGGYAAFDFSIDNHTLTVIEADGTDVRPFPVQQLTIANAQRYSVLVTMNQTSSIMRAEINEECLEGDNHMLDRHVKAILRYDGDTIEDRNISDKEINFLSYRDSSTPCVELDAKSLVPLFAMSAPEPDRLIQLDATFDDNVGYFNGMTWNPTSISTLNTVYDDLITGGEETIGNMTTVDQLVVRVDKGNVVDLLINNQDDAGHPFHLHGYKFWILASGKGQFQQSLYSAIDTTNPMRRDTVHIEGESWTLIRFVADNPGIWAFHCHIVWHSASGLMMQLMVLEGLDQLQNTDEWRALCGANP